jgi:hypothetical protein
LQYLQRFVELETDEAEKRRIQAIIRRLRGARQELIAARAAERDVPRRPSPASPQRAGPSPYLLASAGLSALAFVVASVFGARALALAPGPSDATGGSRDADDVRADARAAHHSAVVADVSLLVGLVSGGTAAALYLGRQAPSEPDLPGGTVHREPVSTKVTFDVGVRF